MALLTRTVINTYAAPSGTATATGRVRFRPNATLTSPGNDSIIPRTYIDATLANGAISQALVRCDDPTISPADWAWEVTEEITGAPVRRYLIQLVAGVGSVALADIAHLEAAPALVTYEEIAHKGQPGGYASLGDDGLVPNGQLPASSGSGVTSVNGDTGPAVVLDNTDVGAAATVHTHAYDPAGTATSAVSAHVVAPDPHGDRSIAAAALVAHEADTTAVHGIADTSALETQSGATAKVSTHAGASDPHGDRAAATAALASHEADTTSVHGIADTAVLETTTGSAAKVTTHAGASDPHADRAFATSAVSTHTAASDPHGDRAFATSAVSTHSGASDPHADRAFATSAVTTHTGATDPHADRAYTDTQVATRTLKPTIQTLTADPTGNSTTTPADLTGLALSVPAAGTYDFSFFVPYRSSITGNAMEIRLKSSGAPTSTIVTYTIALQSTATTTTRANLVALDTPVTAATVGATTTTYLAEITGRIIATGAGTLVPQFAIGSGSASTATVKSGAYARLQPVT